MSKIAVLLATYNGEKYIKELLQSLDNQDFQDFHCYIHDDGSTDRTVEIIQKFIKGKDKYELIDKPPVGNAVGNFLLLLEFIDDETYIMFCDQDDVWLKNKIQLSLQLIENEPEKNVPLVACTDLKVVDSRLNVIADSYFLYENRNINYIHFNNMIKKNVSPGCAMIINRQMRNCILSNKNLAFLTLHDWAIMIIGSLYGKIIISKEKTILYRQHGDNVVGAKNKKGVVGIIDQIVKVISFSKFILIKKSVKLEKDIIIALLNNISQEFPIKKDVDIRRYQKLTSENKCNRMKEYIDVNKKIGVRRYVRALFI